MLTLAESGGGGLSRYAAFGDGGVTFKNNGSIQSYDHHSAPLPGDAGFVSSGEANLAGNGLVETGNGGTIDGKVFLGSGGGGRRVW